ncbi:MAG: PDZ domain-containing protein [Chloracidobacterium sp.]|nr:PDZ domain-containing protein [Chloracidobacterium sp.]
MSIKTFSYFALFAVSVISGACKTGILAGSEAPSTVSSAPAAPLVVDGNRTSYADVVDKTSPAVVRIEAEHKENQQNQPQMVPFGDDMFRQMPQPRQMPNQRPQIERGLGSGVIVSSDGTVLTNYHVVDGAEKITVLMSDNKSFDAKVIGSDKLSDLAVLKIDAQQLPFLTLGILTTFVSATLCLPLVIHWESARPLLPGSFQRKVGGRDSSDGSFEDFLQTDAPINRGNSGGALVNLTGELIGINSQILSPGGASGGNIGIGFSIPSNMAQSVLEQLLKDGKVRRGMLGINIQNVTDDIAKALDLKDKSGILVSNVKTGSAADKAGVKRNDIISAINGEKLEDSNFLRNKVAQTSPGTAIKLTVIRDGKEVELTATLDELNTDDQSKGSNPKAEPGSPESSDQGGKLGLSLEPVTPVIAKQLGLDSNDGLVVADIDPNGPAATAGISRGDVILEINKRPISSVADVKTVIDASAGKPILLLITRRGQTIYLTIRPE